MTKRVRLAALLIVSLLAMVSIGGSLLERVDYMRQDRQSISVSPSRQHWLGTDPLGRDRFARLLYGTRVSLLLAPAAAALSTLLALVLGAAPGFLGNLCERVAKVLIDLMLSIPWLFLLLIVRAMLPLNLSPGYSAAATFLMLGLLGWGVPARILMARARYLRQSDFLVMARCAGVRPWRLLCVHLMPNLWPVLLAQFLIAVPVFILAEANLSLLGLGVSEPLPSLGSLLRELETVLSIRAEWCIFAPLFMLLAIVSSLQIAVSQSEVP
jgi:ABC-type dipeptide/oligopeptide/nickel transport system permease subunit